VTSEVKELRAELRAALKHNAELVEENQRLRFELTAAIPPLQLFARKYARCLTSWEREFLESLAKWSGPLSPKQRDVVDRIAGKTGARVPLPSVGQTEIRYGYTPMVH
jgi:hypothetical protein